MTLKYKIPYEVPASTYMDAIWNANALLRTGVRVVKVEHAAPTVPGWWEVLLSVEEDAPESVQRALETNGPVTMAKAEADRA